METLVLDGKTFVKASKAARDFGYTSDYVGQLCRGGKIKSHLVGRTWYVDVSELGTHRVEKKRMSRVKAREHAHKAIEEHKRLTIQTEEEVPVKVKKVRYENDDAELIPTVRKLEIAEEKKHYLTREVEKDESAPYTLENEGKKIRMAGKLDIIDVSEDMIEDGTVLLQPKIMRKTKAARKVMAEAIEGIEEEAGYGEDVAIATAENTEPRSFADKLALLDAENEPNIAVASEELTTLSISDPVRTRKERHIVGNLLLFIFFILILLTPALSTGWTIHSTEDEGGTMSAKTSFAFDIKKTISQIKLKI